MKPTDKKFILMIVVALAASSIVLALTLDVTVALIVFILMTAVAIFQKSFSKGWLFLFFILLIFPTVKISDESIFLYDLLLVVMALVGILKLSFDSPKFPSSNINYPFFLLVLLSFSFGVLGKIFLGATPREIWQVSLLILLFWITTITFKYYFQTLKRINLFLKVIVVAGTLHSMFGLLSFLFGVQTPSGMGISNGKMEYLIFGEVRHQINGFLGIGLFEILGDNPLAPLLMITIPVTIGYYLIQKEKNKGVDDFNQQTTNWGKRIFEIIKRRENLFLPVLFVQAIAFLLTFSYHSMVFLLMGILIMGILLRNRMLISSPVFLIIALTAVFPSMYSSVTIKSTENLTKWFGGISSIFDSWIFGSGWKMIPKSNLILTGKVYNSYLYNWFNFGIFGILILLGLLKTYFLDVRRSYLKSDGEKRIWLIVILTILAEFFLEAMTNNTLFYGPAALIFWLLYAVAINLREKPVIYGLTETKLLE